MCVFLLTVFFSCSFSCNIIVLSVLSILAVSFVTVSFLSDKFKSICRYLCIIFLSSAVGMLFCVLHYNTAEKPVINYLQEYAGTPVSITAKVKDVKSSSFMTSFDLQVFEVNGEKCGKFNLSLNVFGECQAEIDDILETSVIFKNLEDDLTSQTSITYYKSSGYYISADYYENSDNSAGSDSSDTSEEANPVYNLKITPAQSHSLTYYLDAIRNYTKDTFFRNVKLDYHDSQTAEAGVVYGAFTGDKSYIDSSVQTDFKRSGISYVLAVAGLQLSILCGIIFSFLKILNIHKKASCVIIILCCLFYMAFTGFSVSVIRAGIMTVLFYAAFMFGRKSDSVTSLFIAGMVVILLNPYNSLNTGFQLSFMATLGIVTTSNLSEKIQSKINNIPIFEFLIKIIKMIFSSAAITIAAVVFTLPITSYAFHTLSLVSLATSIVASPLVTAILLLALIMMIFALIPFFKILTFFGTPLYYISKLLLFFAKFFASFKYSYIAVNSTNSDSFYIFALIFLTIVILCLYIISKLAVFEENIKIKRARLILYSSVAVTFIIMTAVLIYPRILFKDSSRVAYYSDDKNQDIVLFDKDYDSADIIDISDGTLSHVPKTYDMLVENGAVNINSIILTHYHKRHIQMIQRYLTYSNIKKVYIPEPLTEYDIEVYNSLYYLSIEPNSGFELIKYGSSLKLDDNITISTTIFDYNKMQHIMVNTIYSSNNLYKDFLYLSLGYEDGFSNYTDGKNYDVVFYGTHRHNKRDDNYTSNVYGTFAGVLSSYLDSGKNKTTQKLDIPVLDEYITGGSVLLKSDDYNSIVFEINRTGDLKYWLK
ncbi:MAG: ComEC/Rec2 family competence protein [Oscillospiraceae bacterium]|nr:ComEC/Rec2 family competence protein [Oscillospiraceae bacterium]